MTTFPRCYETTRVDAPHDPVRQAAVLADAFPDEPHVVYEQGDTWTFCTGALAEIVVDGERVHLIQDGRRRGVPWHGRPLRAVAELLDGLPLPEWRAYGWAAFELAASSGGAPADRTGSLLHLLVPRDEVRVTAGTATLRTTRPAVRDRLADLLRQPPAEVRPAGGVPGLDLCSGGDEYRRRIADVVAGIAAGEYEKVVLSRVVPVPGAVDLTETFVLGRRHNTPARSFLMRLGPLRVAGFSPELVVTVSADGWVRTQPLAGTRARTARDAEDRRLREELLRDAKEIHEHRISVEAARDELAAVCAPGSVTVDEYLTVKQRGSVQHLASRLSGRLAPGRDRWDAFDALFPAITVSGVPKPRAVAAIRRFEATPRGPYGGAVLAVDSDGTLDATLVLRSVFEEAGRVWLRAGAGIVDRSTPDRELEETCEKLRSVAPYLVLARRPAALT